MDLEKLKNPEDILDKLSEVESTIKEIQSDILDIIGYVEKWVPLEKELYPAYEELAMYKQVQRQLIDALVKADKAAKHYS